MKLLIEEQDETQGYRPVPVEQFLAMVKVKRDRVEVRVPNLYGMRRITFLKNGGGVIIEQKDWLGVYRPIEVGYMLGSIEDSLEKLQVIAPNLCGGVTRIIKFKSTCPEGNGDNVKRLNPTWKRHLESIKRMVK